MRVSDDKNEHATKNRQRASKVFGDQKQFIESERGQRMAEAPTPVDWKRTSHVRTKTALERERKQGLAPHPSYDIDGDGVVSAYDFFIASKFDWDRDGRLNTAERRNVDEALAHGFTERMEQAHALQKSTIGGRLFKSLYLGNDDDDDGVSQPKVTRSKLMETRKMELMEDLAQKYQPTRQKQFDAFEARKAKKPSSSRRRRGSSGAGSIHGNKTKVQASEWKEDTKHVVPPLYSTRSELLEKRKQRDIQDYEEKQQQQLGSHKTRHQRVMELEEERIAYRMAAPKGRTYRDVVRERKEQGAKKYNDLDARKTAHGVSEDQEALEQTLQAMHANATNTTTASSRRLHRSRHNRGVAEDPFKDHRGPPLHAQRQHTSRVGPVGMMRAPAPELRLPSPSASKSFRNTGFSTDLLNRKRMQKFLQVQPKESNVPFEIDITGSGGMFSSFSDDKVFHPPQLPKLDERNQAVSLARLHIARRHRQQQQQSLSLGGSQQESTVDRPYTAPIAPDEDDIRRMSMLSTPRDREGVRHGGFQTLRALGKIY